MNFYCAACDKRLFDGTIKLYGDNNISRRPTRTRMTRVPFVRSVQTWPRARRNSVITFWIGSSELGVQSPSLALSPYVPRRLSLFLPALLPLPRSPFRVFVVLLSPTTASPSRSLANIITDCEVQANGWSMASRTPRPQPIITSLWLTQTSRRGFSRFYDSRTLFEGSPTAPFV